MRDCLASVSDTVEPDGPEICYAVLNPKTAMDDARRITEAITTTAGAKLAVGLGRTKLLSRRAALHVGNGDLLHIAAGEEARFLAALPLSAFEGFVLLDHKTRQAFARLGVRTLGDILALPPHRLPKTLQKVGKQLFQWAQGHDADPVKPLWPPRTLANLHRFEDETGDRFLVERSLKGLTERLACGLSANREFARQATLTVGFADGTFLAETERLALPESQAVLLYRAATRLLNRLPIEQPILSLEVTLSDLGAGSGAQLALLDTKGGAFPDERRRRLDATVTHLRKRYGPRAVITAWLLIEARRIHLWTFPLGHLLDEEVRVGVSASGDPMCYWRSARRGRPAGRYQVQSIQNRWRETERKGSSVLTDRDVWRVVTDPFGVSELHQLEARWRLAASWD